MPRPRELFSEATVPQLEIPVAITGAILVLLVGATWRKHLKKAGKETPSQWRQT